MTELSPAIEASRERERLLALLRRDGILRSTPDAPITHRSGEVAPWAFYSWGLSLSQEGLRLAARELLRALEGFGSTQIVSYGYTGLPLLAACVLEGGGRYTGLSIRETRKPYLTNRRIDGAVDRSRTVVVIDDSLSSGTSLHKAIVALEDEGLEVEGTAALVHFPFRGRNEFEDPEIARWQRRARRCCSMHPFRRTHSGTSCRARCRSAFVNWG